MPTACVMLSTYNGEKYLQEQLDSILAQQDIDIILLVRDDGSSDKTLPLLKEYANQHDNIQVEKGKNIGVVRSFFTLAKTALKIHADIYAFADQDDFWYPDKLVTSYNKIFSIADQTKPIAYSSALYYADQNLKIIGRSRIPKHKTFQNAVVENILTGCTASINRSMLEMFCQSNSVSNSIPMHDHWLYLIATAIGQFIYNEQPMILYRQHKNNVIGYKKGMKAGLNKIARIVKNKGGKQASLNVFAQTYHPYLSNKAITYLNYLSKQRNFFQRIICVIFFKQQLFIRQSFADNILFYLNYIILGL